MARSTLRRHRLPASLVAIALWSSTQLSCFVPAGRHSDNSPVWQKLPELRRELRDLRELRANADPGRSDGPPFWRQLLSAGCAALVGLAQATPVLAEQSLNTIEQQTISLFERNTPGVVFITSEVFQISNAARMEIEAVPRGTGSGWVFDKEGHIITNYHVIQGSNAVTVKFIEGTEVIAKVVGADPGSDVAVLQVELTPDQKKLLRPLQRGSSTAIRVGQDVFAIGNPFGLDHTLTRGIVSGVGRTITSVGGRPIQGAIQTDASINPGNSGGPLLNSGGEVIGMNTVIVSPTGASAGVGFAIPSDTVAARVTSILKYGYVKRPSLGLYLGQDGISKRIMGKEGCIVAGLRQRDSAGGEAGIIAGDIIVEVDGKSIKRVNDIFAALDEHQPGEVIEVKLFRPNNAQDMLVPDSGVQYKELSLKVTLKEAPVEREQ